MGNRPDPEAYTQAFAIELLSARPPRCLFCDGAKSTQGQGSGPTKVVPGVQRFCEAQHGGWL